MIAILLFICKAFAVLLFSFGISFFSLFFDMIIQPGMIGHFYLRFLVKRFGRKENRMFAVIEQLPEYNLRFEQHLEFALKNGFFIKPLGVCMLCANVWHSTLIFLSCFFVFNTCFEWWWIFPCIFTSSFYLRYLMAKL